MIKTPSNAFVHWMHFVHAFVEHDMSRRWNFRDDEAGTVFISVGGLAVPSLIHGQSLRQGMAIASEAHLPHFSDNFRPCRHTTTSPMGNQRPGSQRKKEKRSKEFLSLEKEKKNQIKILSRKKRKKISWQFSIFLIFLLLFSLCFADSIIWYLIFGKLYVDSPWTFLFPPVVAKEGKMAKCLNRMFHIVKNVN